MPPPSIEVVLSEVESLRARVALLERRRRHWSLLVVAVLVGVGLFSRVSFASGSACSEVLPGLLTPFCADEPAMASAVTQNYRELIKLVELKVGTISVASGVAPGAAGTASIATAGLNTSGNVTAGSMNTGSLSATSLSATSANIQTLTAVSENGYVLSCGHASYLGSVQGNPFCCRMNVSNGDTVCNVATNANGSAWSTTSFAYPGLAATTTARYTLACNAGEPGANFPFCCRMNVNTGAATCGQGNSYSLGSSGQANVPF
ncbi:MAG: hypothetical protein GQE15_18635 [Archangiaceae bacterium]|nr:hypothetical protein [Archangiaceae bacterium]